MSDKLPGVTAKQLIKAVHAVEFEPVRQSGSHMIFRNHEAKRIVIPYHTGKCLHPKLVSSILKDIDLSVEDLKKML
jgi:predicted RNA binding protein YcfA (HicA-like mRNA interferase family)